MVHQWYTEISIKIVASVSTTVPGIENMAAYNTNHGDQYRFQYLVYSENYHVCLLITTRTNEKALKC